MNRDPLPATASSGADLERRLRAELDALSGLDRQQARRDLLELARAIAIDTPASESLLDAIFGLVIELNAAGQYRHMLALSRVAVRMAYELGNTNAQRRAQSILGGALIYVDELPEAADALLQALALARDLGDPNCEAPVLHNLGLLFQNLGQYATARRCTELALRKRVQGPSALSIDRLWNNIALSDLYLGRYAAAAEAARIPARNSADGVLDQERAWGKHIVVRALLALRRTDEARQHAPMPDDAAGSANPLARFVDRLTAGLLGVLGTAPDQAIADLKAAISIAREESPAQLPEALATLTQALELVGRSDEALTYVHDMMARTRVSLADRVRASLPTETAGAFVEDPYVRALQDRAVTLHISVAGRINDLISGAVIGCEQAGADRHRVFRAARLAELFALHLEWSTEAAATLRFSVLLMDAGLQIVPAYLTNQRRSLTDAERRIVHEHVTAGADFLDQARLRLLQPAIPVARCHHERWDGGGPLGLTGKAIPLEARMAALADVYEALTHDRPWREAMTASAALRTIDELAGTQFDPDLAARFVPFVKALYWEHDRLDRYLAESAQELELPYLLSRDRIDLLLTDSQP